MTTPMLPQTIRPQETSFLQVGFSTKNINHNQKKKIKHPKVKHVYDILKRTSFLAFVMTVSALKFGSSLLICKWQYTSLWTGITAYRFINKTNLLHTNLILNIFHPSPMTCMTTVVKWRHSFGLSCLHFSLNVTINLSAAGLTGQGFPFAVSIRVIYETY